MNDDKMAKEYNIEGGSVLHLVRARGPRPAPRLAAEWVPPLLSPSQPSPAPTPLTRRLAALLP